MRPIAVVPDVFGVQHIFKQCPYDPFGLEVVRYAEMKMAGFELPELSNKGQELVIQAIGMMRQHRDAINNHFLLSAMFGKKG